MHFGRQIIHLKKHYYKVKFDIWECSYKTKSEAQFLANSHNKKPTIIAVGFLYITFFLAERKPSGTNIAVYTTLTTTEAIYVLVVTAPFNGKTTAIGKR